MAELVNCWCEKSGEPCPRKATQEDMLCDPCRDGCATLSVATRTGTHTFPADAAEMKVVGTHVEVGAWR